MKHLNLIGTAFLFALPLLAQDDVSLQCGENAAGIEALICSNDMLKADHEALAMIWKTWVTGVNAENMDYIKIEQQAWLEDRETCLEETDPEACLQSRYEERIVVLSKPRFFQQSTQIDGKDFVKLSALAPLSSIGLSLEKSIAEESYAKDFRSRFEAQTQEPADAECPLCTFKSETVIEKGYQGANLVVLEEAKSEAHDDQDPVFHNRAYWVDPSSNSPISFLDLFDPSTAPFAKTALIEEIIGALTRLNNAVSGNENGETRYFWNETDANLQAQGEEEWNAMGLFPVTQNGKISGFTYRADSYEFAPYGSSNYFSGFEIDAAPIIPFLKPQYRENFK